MTKTALVLAGHGSHISPETAGIVWQQVDALRARGAADEVTAAFWKEMPSFHQVFCTLSAPDITIVPLFTAQGYFTQTVIPAEMGLDGEITRHDGRTIRYAQPYGQHSRLTEIVIRRVQDALAQFQLTPQSTAAVIIGHGTKRSPQSRAATEAQAQQVRAAGLVAYASAVYLDDDPAIPSIYDTYNHASTSNIIVVPYFLAPGSHTTVDVPEALGLASGDAAGVVRGYNIFYMPPVGLDDGLLEVILDLAHAAGMPPKSIQQPASSWGHFPAVGRDELITAVMSAGEVRFGQLILTPSQVYPVTETPPHMNTEIIHDPGTLRQRIRENPFRPLAVTDDLPGGWRVLIHEPAMLHAVVETVYPSAVADWAAAQNGSFTPHTLVDTLSRQTGMYRKLTGQGESATAALVREICGRCVLHPSWFDRHTGTLPCFEPCNWWLSQAVEAETTTD